MEFLADIKQTRKNVLMNLRDLFKIHSAEKRRLIENFLSLSVLQAANYILPLITLPYLVRVLEPDKFGLIAFSQAFIGYFMVLTDYGFNLSATREISINRDNREKVSEIFNSVMIIKLGLLVLALLLMTVIVFSFEKFRKDWIVYYLTFGMVVGQVLFPTWFFQGMERMKYITFLNILAKLIFTGAIFVFVREQAHYIYVPLINSLGFIISGILALCIVFKDFGVKIMLPPWEDVKRELKEGWHIFVSQISGNLYGQGTVFILGLLSTNVIVGYYSAAERLMKAITSLSQPLAQALFPYTVRLYTENRNRFVRNFIKVISFSIIFSFLISLFSWLSADLIIHFLYGKRMVEAIPIFKMLSIAMFFTILNVIKQPYIYALKLDKLNLLMYMFVGLTFIPICFIFTIMYSAIGTAFSLVYVEVMVFILGLLIILVGIKNECQIK